MRSYQIEDAKARVLENVYQKGRSEKKMGSEVRTEGRIFEVGTGKSLLSEMVKKDSCMNGDLIVSIFTAPKDIYSPPGA